MGLHGLLQRQLYLFTDIYLLNFRSNWDSRMTQGTHYIHKEPEHISMRRTYSHTGKITAATFEENANLYLGAPCEGPIFLELECPYSPDTDLRRVNS
jgi:hypothetical protein